MTADAQRLSYAVELLTSGKPLNKVQQGFLVSMCKEDPALKEILSWYDVTTADFEQVTA